MNEQLNIPATKFQDEFTAELEKAVDDILNNWSDEEIDRALQAEDFTFLNQVTPEGRPLASPDHAQSESVCVYSWGNFELATKFTVAAMGATDIHFVPSPEQAADRLDLALAA